MREETETQDRATDTLCKESEAEIGLHEEKLQRNQGLWETDIYYQIPSYCNIYQYHIRKRQTYDGMNVEAEG
jgi:hypothetical protein